ncbi:MAG: DUF3048 domain-containing protein [Bacillota bacterium]|nr:DUF3048 domain-containing protein [Bacillota bacterium]MDD3298766.1 DUF3048 domain-containing protein [Bacillota bacterium]MDD3850385.1 DUF3048 domain-containing protein [Bacillota bacterium]MDD4708012.1 DUF3048 domain-containing protein [Bacillota bacterium]
MKNREMPIAIIVIFLVSAAITAVVTIAYNKPAPAPPEGTLAESETTERVGEEEPETPKEPVFVDGVICPLGGEMIERSDLYPRPVAVMLDNHPAARPQAGLEQAEVVYEILAEGNITRYMALFVHGADQLVGPVRSARSYYIDKAMEYNAVYLHAGGSPQAWDDIARLKIPSFNAMHIGAPLYWREKHRKEPHNVYTALDRIQVSAEGRGFNKTEGIKVHSFNEEDEGIVGEKAERVSIAYPQKYRVSYEYSKEEGVYLRYVLDKPHVDEKNAGYQVRAKNIIIQRAVHKVVDSEGRREIGLVGSGKGIYITNGRYVPITWEKTDRRSPTRFLYEDGEEINLNPGKTWIQVVPTGSGVTLE